MKLSKSRTILSFSFLEKFSDLIENEGWFWKWKKFGKWLNRKEVNGSSLKLEIIWKSSLVLFKINEERNKGDLVFNCQSQVLVYNIIRIHTK